MSESFSWDVVRGSIYTLSIWTLILPQAYSTTFDQITQLRELMLKFLEDNGRDFLPGFDVMVVGECRPSEGYLAICS